MKELIKKPYDTTMNLNSSVIYLLLSCILALLLFLPTVKNIEKSVNLCPSWVTRIKPKHFFIL